MKNLFLMQGLPGSGKSTFLKELGLVDKGLVISSDSLRLLYNPIFLNVEGYTMPSKNDKNVWDLLFKLLQNRMEQGETTIVDATHYNLKSIQKYKTLCERYGYSLEVVDFTDIPIIEVLDRNKKRDFKEVSEEVILRMNKTLQEELPTYPHWIKRISREEFSSRLILGFEPRDFSSYEKIIVFGDIHGCLEPLKEYFKENPYNENYLYIFIGDYLDRGIQNKETLEYLISLSNNKNVKFLEGNHERWLRYYGKGQVENIRSKEFLEKTVWQIKDIPLEDIRVFCRKFSTFLYFSFENRKFLLTHAGINTLPNLILSEDNYIKGIGRYEDSENVDNCIYEFSKKLISLGQVPLISIHGHRNIFDKSIQNTEFTYNLEGKIENGGYLRILEISKDLIKPIEIKNNVYLDINSNDEIIKSLEHNRLIRVKELKNGIRSFNFTKDAFIDKKWNSQTVRARGLFIDKDNNIIARSYDKFFNLNETPETSIEYLRKNLKFPVSCWKKENGYLGLLSWNPYINDYFIATKSTDEKDFADNFRRILYDKYRIHLNEDLKNFLKKEKVTFLFEIIDPAFDPHIIDYDEEKAVLLDIVTNDFNPLFLSTQEIYALAIKYNFPHKELIYEAKNMEELEDFFEEFKYKHFEGVVICDKQGFRFKWKSDFYSFWKCLRNRFLRMSPDFIDKYKEGFSKEIEFVKNFPEEQKSKYIENGQFRIIKFYKQFYQE